MTLQKAPLVDGKVCLHATSHCPSNYIVTARKRSLGQGNVFTPICDSFCSGEGVPSLGGGEGAILGEGGLPSLGGSMKRGAVEGDTVKGEGAVKKPPLVNKRAVRILLECFLVSM